MPAKPLPFISFYFPESGLFNGLRSIEMKKLSHVSGYVRNVSTAFSISFLPRRRGQGGSNPPNMKDVTQISDLRNSSSSEKSLSAEITVVYRSIQTGYVNAYRLRSNRDRRPFGSRSRPREGGHPNARFGATRNGRKPRLSCPRKRASSNVLMTLWIPACAGMTTAAIRSQSS